MILTSTTRPLKVRVVSFTFNITYNSRCIFIEFYLNFWIRYESVRGSNFILLLFILLVVLNLWPTIKYYQISLTLKSTDNPPNSSPICSELSQDMNGNSQAAATRQKMSQLEQMLSALDQLRRVGPLYTPP
jgi:hypothetical protein